MLASEQVDPDPDLVRLQRTEDAHLLDAETSEFVRRLCAGRTKAYGDLPSDVDLDAIEGALDTLGEVDDPRTAERYIEGNLV